MKALRSFPYAGKRLNPGDEFDAQSSRDAQILSIIGQARKIEMNIPAVRMKEPEGETEDAPKKKRRYRRRDMQAEDECSSD